MDIEKIVDLIKEEIASALNQDSQFVDQKENFLKLGISSIQMIKITNKINKKLGIDISSISMFEYKDITEFANYISECFSNSIVSNC